MADQVERYQILFEDPTGNSRGFTSVTVDAVEVESLINGGTTPVNGFVKLTDVQSTKEPIWVPGSRIIKIQPWKAPLLPKLL